MSEVECTEEVKLVVPTKLKPNVVSNQNISLSNKDNEILEDVLWKLRHMESVPKLTDHIRAHGIIYLVSDVINVMFDNVDLLRNPDLKMLINNIIDLSNNPDNDGARYSINDTLNNIGDMSWSPVMRLSVDLEEGTPFLLSKTGVRIIFVALGLEDGYKAINTILSYATRTIDDKKDRLNSY